MNLLNKTFYRYDYKHGALVKKWGKVIDITDDQVIVFNPSNPQGYKIFHITQSEIEEWIIDKHIFLKEKNP